MSSIPTAKDWNMAANGIDQDISHAYRMFDGKTHEESVAMFEEASMVYQEDLMLMPLACFKFYVRAYLEYLNSDKSTGDSDGASCFFSLVQFRFNEFPALDENLRNWIFDTLKFISDHQVRFDAESEIYGSFKDQANKLLGKRSHNPGG